MSTPADHVLLTRFNLPSPGLESLVRAREGWLRDRIELFERYTVPSVAAQTNPAVRWIVYLDPESPEWLLERLRPHASSGLLRPILRTSVSDDELRQDIRTLLDEAPGGPRPVLITSNLDNDDGLARDFSARLLEVESEHPRVGIYLTAGLVQGHGALYLHHDRRNAFRAVRERWDAVPRGVWCEYHTELARQMPVMELDGRPAWLQVVHGDNVSNRVRGRLVSPTTYAAGFATPFDATTPPARAVLLDRTVGAPLREGRDTLRHVVRASGLRLLGKGRYDAWKAGFARRFGRARGVPQIGEIRR